MFTRTAATVTALAAAMGLALSFRTPPSPSSGTATAPPPPASSSASSPASTSTPSGAPPSGGGSPAPSTAPVATSAPQAAALKNGTFTGTSYPNFYGAVQVQVVISGGRITDVKTLQSPNDNPQSAYIASVAMPYLRQEVLAAQNAQINYVSGATFDSQSYARSVQSALDAARA